jgi:hypothetical protein
MGRRIKIQVGDEVAIAELVEDKAPNTCAYIWSQLPIEGRATSAKICDNELMLLVPFTIEEKENPKIPEPGDLGFWATRPQIDIWFDKTTPLGPTNHWATIVENLDGLARAGRLTWHRQGMRMHIDKAE